MIECFTASAYEIKEPFDFSRVGTGTGIARHGFGMYFGNPKTVSHYFDSYSRLDSAHADNQAHIGESFFSSETDEYSLLKKIKTGEIDFSPSDFENHLSLYELSDPDFDLNSISFRSGVVHQVDLHSINMREVKDWDDAIGEGEMLDLQISYLKEYYSENELPFLDYEGLGLEGPYSADEIDTLFNDLFDLAYDDGLENDYFSGTSEHHLEEAWDMMVCNGSGHEFEDELIEGIGERFETTIRALVSVGLNWSDGLTYGDVVENITNSYKANGYDDAGIKTARFLSRNNIPALTGDNYEGTAKELVVYDERVLAHSKFTPISEGELRGLVEAFDFNEMEPDEDLDRSRDRMFSPR